MDTYRAVLIGCGRMGATIDDEVAGRPHSYIPYSHAAGHTAADRVELVAAADIDGAQLAAARDRYGIPRGYSDYREMIDAESPDIVSIATRPGPHLEMVRAAAEGGVPAIYCEKPLCQSMAEADELVSICQSEGVIFNLGVNRRFIPLYRTVRDRIADGAIGEVRAITGHVGGGSTLWSHSHFADLLLFLAGDPEVEWVQAEAACDADDLEGNRLRTDPALSMGYVRFATGVRGYLTRGSGTEFEIDGTDGKIRTTNNGLDAAMRVPEGDWNLLEETSFPTPEPRSGTLGCIEELVAALDGDADTSAPIEVAAAGHELCLGWLQSQLAEGKRIELPLEDRSFSVEPGDW